MLTNPKYSMQQALIYRLKVGTEIFDIRAKVIDIIYSRLDGYSYKLDLPKSSLSSDIISEVNLRPDPTA